MSLFDYRRSEALYQADVPFDALIMAAMRKADTVNTYKLRSMWPDLWSELERRYHSPGGVLHGDPGQEQP